MVAQRSLHFGEARHCPDAVAPEVDDRPGLPQLLMEGIWIAEETLVERVDIQNGNLGHAAHGPIGSQVLAMPRP